jgi:uncharacterized membrane protein
MIAFLFAIAVFLAAHILPAATGLRGILIERLGRPVYLSLYSLISLATIAWVIVAAVAAPYVELWPPDRAVALLPVVLMLPASVLFVAAAGQPSPLSVSFRGGLPAQGRTGLSGLLRHPLLWAFFLWSGSHLIANGDVVGVILFGSLSLFSLFGMKRLETRAARRLSPEDLATVQACYAGGLAARVKRLSPWRLVIEAGLGVLLYAALLHLHGPVIGVDPRAWL